MSPLLPGGDALKRLDRPVSAVATPILRAMRGIGRRGSGSLILRPGGMGDLILLQLAVERLGLDPRSFTWMIEQRSAVWAERAALPSIVYDRSFARTMLSVANQFSTVVNSEQRFGLAMATAAWATGRKGSLVGFDTNLAASLATTSVEYDWRDRHELHEFAQLIAAAFGVPVPADLFEVPRRRPSSGRSVVALGGVHAESRMLDAQTWLWWIRSVAGDQPLDLVHGPGERELGDELLRIADGQLTARTGSFGLTADVIEHAERVITIDGGLVHVASYSGVPADVLFTAGRDRKWAPLGAGSTVHHRDDLPCRPCTVWGQVPPCPIAFACRKDLQLQLRSHPTGT